MYSLKESSTHIIVQHHRHSSPELIHIPTLTLLLVNNHFPVPLPTAPGNHHSTFCFYEFD